MNLQRTQIYLEKPLHQALRREAQRQGISLAELIRRLVKQYLSRRSSIPLLEKDEYMSIVGLDRSGLSDVSERHDQYLRETLSRKRSR